MQAISIIPHGGTVAGKHQPLQAPAASLTVSGAKLQAALHPTPATCGRPRDKALALLQTSEGFDRGYFAGPFGWLSGCGAEFAVAIRSALLSPARLLMDPDSSMVHQQQTVSLYAGVGIVRGSQPMSEWQVGRDRSICHGSGI